MVLRALRVNIREWRSGICEVCSWLPGPETRRGRRDAVPAGRRFGSKLRPRNSVRSSNSQCTVLLSLRNGQKKYGCIMINSKVTYCTCSSLNLRAARSNAENVTSLHAVRQWSPSLNYGRNAPLENMLQWVDTGRYSRLFDCRPAKPTGDIVRAFLHQ